MQIKLLTFVSFFIFLTSVRAQSSYIDTDSSSLVGIELVAGTKNENFKFITQRIGNTEKKYFPDEIAGYGLANGKKFKAFDVGNNEVNERYFLEQLASGKFMIYYLAISSAKGFYYTENDSSLVRISNNKEEYRLFFEDKIEDCALSVKNLKNLKLNRLAVKSFFQEYKECSRTPFRVQIELNAGISFNKLSASNSTILSQAGFTRKPGYFLGFNIVPITKSNNSIRTGILFKDFSSSYRFNRGPIQHFLIVENTTIEIPLLYRYTFRRSKLEPYIEAGPTYIRSISGRNQLITDEINTDEILFKQLMGIGIGVGILSNKNAKIPWFLRLRFNQLSNLDDSSLKMNLSENMMSFGILL